MSGLLLRLAAIFVCAALTACAATSALEPQHTQLAPRNARIFILRPGAIAGAVHAVTVKINGAKVGSIANNSYLSVDRPPGRYKIEASFSLTIGNGNEHETEVEAGRSYYFVFNAPGMTVAGNGLFMHLPGPALGKQVGSRDYWVGTYLGQLDASTGAAALSNLKAP
jgi:hypothetical protein